MIVKIGKKYIDHWFLVPIRQATKTEYEMQFIDCFFNPKEFAEREALIIKASHYERSL